VDYKLEILFNNDNDDILYEGISYIKKNLSDTLKVTENSIILSFSRSKTFRISELFNTPSSLVRYGIQRALCFYLSIVGNIPDVKSIHFINPKNKIGIEHSELTRDWQNCNIDICLPKEVCSIIFTSHKKAKAVYIALTYFLKAQLACFSNDCFRAAWSGLNSIYNWYKNNDGDSERKLIDRFADILKDMQLCNTISFLKGFDYKIWHKIEWHNFINSQLGKKVTQLLSPNKYPDFIVLSQLLFYYKKENFDILDAEKQVKNIIKNKELNYKVQLKFLLCKYCYFQRNRYFHAGKAYPLFVLSNDHETKMENVLTKVLLLTIKDFLTEEFQQISSKKEFI